MDIAIWLGRILGIVAGLGLQALVIAPALGPGPLTIVAFIALVVGGLVVGDWVARTVGKRSGGNAVE
jgi:hypothetical protein